ncbi:MAG: pyridoxamine 5'-phosphate oxidase family protein [Myxococcota bacterium]
MSLLGNMIAFHSAPVGEKIDLIGQSVVVSAEEIIAEIPSYFLDPQRACPATTYYQSVQIHGTLEAIEDPGVKTMLQGLMANTNQKAVMTAFATTTSSIANRLTDFSFRGCL